MAIEGCSGGEERDVDGGDKRRTGAASFVFIRARLPLLCLVEDAVYCGQDEGDNDDEIEGEEEQLGEDRARW